MAQNRYDQASRHLARRAEGRLWPWLLRLSKEQVRFEGLLETHFTVPGFPERVGDLVAALTDIAGGGRPWAMCLEFQSEPDFDMPDRLLVTLGLLRLTVKPPSAGPGDRYWVGAVVVNLTGQGIALRDLEWREAGVRVLLKPREWNLRELEASVVLDEVKQGGAPIEALAWFPVMKGANKPGMLKRWLDLARGETDPQRRADLGLAVVFAELVGTQDVWRKALEGWNMKESPIVKEWEAKAKAELLIHILEKRFTTVPEDLRTAILAQQDADRLTAWVDIALERRTLRRFRQEAGV